MLIKWRNEGADALSTVDKMGMFEYSGGGVNE